MKEILPYELRVAYCFSGGFVLGAGHFARSARHFFTSSGLFAEVQNSNSGSICLKIVGACTIKSIHKENNPCHSATISVRR